MLISLTNQVRVIHWSSSLATLCHDLLQDLQILPEFFLLLNKTYIVRLCEQQGPSPYQWQTGCFNELCLRYWLTVNEWSIQKNCIWKTTYNGQCGGKVHLKIWRLACVKLNVLSGVSWELKAEFPTADHNAEDVNSFLSEVSKQSPITEALWVLEGLFFVRCIQWLLYKGTQVCSLTGSVLLAVELCNSSTLLQIL